MKGLTLLFIVFLLQNSFIAKVPGNTFNEVDRLNRQANRVCLINPELSRQLSEKALLLASKINYKQGAGLSFHNIGLAYWAQSYHPMSIYFLNSAVKHLADSTLLIKTYSMIGRNYSELGDFKTAGSYFNKAAKYVVKEKDLIYILAEQSFMFRQQKKTKLAEETALKCLKLAKAEKYDLTTAIIYYRLGYLKMDQNQLVQAKSYLDSCLARSYNPENLRLRASVYVGYSEIENKKVSGDYSKAIMYAKKGLKLSENLGILTVVSRAYTNLITAHEKKGDLKVALAYLQEHNSVRDSIEKVIDRKNTELYNDHFELNLKLRNLRNAEREKNAHALTVKSQRESILLLSIGLILTAGLLGILFYYFKKARNLSQTLKNQIVVLEDQHNVIETQSAYLRNANALKDKLLGVIGHDLRAPISNLQSVVDLFQRDDLTADEAASLIREISPMIDNADFTLKNLVGWAKSQSKGLRLNAEDVNVYSLVQDIQPEFYHPLKQKNITVHNNIAPDFKIKADPHHIKIILRNLLSNAIKFTPDNGLITLTGEAHHDEFVISVSDTGTGMSEEDLALLFSPGFHYSKNGTRGETGTGMGFSLCKELVELNGGKISARSVPGDGTVFSFTIPRGKKGTL